MIMTFSKDVFVERILNGTKKHTIRADRGNRWKVGDSIQMWRGNPRNVKKSPYPFGLSICCKIEYIEFEYIDNGPISIYVDGKCLLIEEIRTLAINDGFDNESDFIKFLHTEKFTTGKIIYWNELIKPYKRPTINQ